MVEKKEENFELDLMFNIDEDEDFEELDRGDEVLDEDEDDEEPVEDEDILDEDEEDVLEEDEDEDDDEDEDASSDIKIPKSRLDEVIAQREEERERVRWLEEQLTKLIEAKPEKTTSQEQEEVPSYDFDTAEEKYAELIIEGETSKAAKLRAEIDNARREEMLSVIKSIESENVKKIESASKQSTEQLKFDSLIEKFESKYEFLNADSDNYNEDAVDTVNTLMAGFVASGLSKTEALQKAVSKVVPMYKQDEPDKLGKSRKAKSIKKSVKAAKAQPPKTRSSGTKNIDLENIDITKLSEKDFEKLTEKEKRILRGD